MSGIDTYVLSQRDEDYVEDEHRNGTNIVLDNVPPVVLASYLVAALSPVIERQTRAPDYRQGHNVIYLRSGEAIQMRPDIVMHIVDNGQHTPQAVDLRVIAIEFGDHKDDGCHEQRECQA